ncbi:MAG: AsmA-like C-terminal region-containing protein [Saprospiraceae bacterium]|nr:AsmA-like C-terminal region-containing protein [Saprospiraceae bacterium]
MLPSDTPDAFHRNPDFSAPPPGTPTPPPYLKPRKKWRWLRRLFIGMLLIVGLPLLALVLIAGFFDRQITDQLIAEINKGLKTELKVGDTRLSLLSGFPSASVDCYNVKLKDAQGGYLLVAETLSFRFDLMSLFGEQVQIHTVRISEGAVRVVVNAQGKANNAIFKESKPTPGNTPAGESTLRLALENAEMVNMAILYDNQLTRQTLEMIVKQANVAGNFSAQQYALSSQANLKIIRFDSDSSRYLAGEQLNYDAVLAVDVKKGLYDLQRVELSVGGNTFAMDGIAVTQPDYTELNLKLASQEGDISMISNLLPGAYHQYFRDFQSTGAYSCSGTVQGRLGKKDQPDVRFEVRLRDGKVNSEKLQSALTNVSFRAAYNAKPDGSGNFEIADFQGSFGGKPFGFNLKISDLNDPLVDFKCNGVLPLEAAYGLFDNEDIRSGDGYIYLNHLNVQGRYADMVSTRRISAVQTSGEIRFEAAELMYNKVLVKMQSGVLRLTDNVFTADSLRLQAGRSDFALQGSAQNLLPVLFADSLNTKDALLEFSAQLESQNMDVNQLLDMFSVQETASSVGEQVLDSLKIQQNAERKLNTDKLKGVFEATIHHFQYAKIDGSNFNGKFEFDHNELHIKGNTDAMQGQLAVEGNAYFELRPSLKMRVTANNLDLQTMMTQCENFGQDVITDKNLRGRLSGKVALWTYWTDTGDFDYDKLKALADVHGTNGELVDLKMLEDFSTFVHIEDLRRVKFTDLQNYIEISKQELYLPAMLIQSNALNLTISGKQSFNNDIDYKLKVNAGQVLLNRIKKHDNDLDPLPAEKGMFNLFYTIVGNLDKYDMKRSKKAVKAEFERSESRKKNISSALEAEFAVPEM